jgi:transcriptional regulator with GAF, ATPase, and Fis domain
LAKNALEAAARPDPGQSATPGQEKLRPLKEELDRLEADRIRKALEASGGNKALAARLMGLTRQNFFYRLKRLGFGQLPPSAPGHSDGKPIFLD